MFQTDNRCSESRKKFINANRVVLFNVRTVCRPTELSVL
jgi:hypothetical protein